MFRIFVVAAVLACLQFAPSTATTQYSTSAPWYAVISLGAGDVHWECIYLSIDRVMPDDHPCGQSRLL
jgi:hypothetical protein